MTSAYNPAFAEHATRVAFNLTLSRNQITALVIVDQHKSGTGPWPYPRSRQTPDMFIPGVRGLQVRGLVEHNPAWRSEKGDPGHEDRDLSWAFRLTEAGNHVLGLLRCAGLVAAEPSNDAAEAA